MISIGVVKLIFIQIQANFFVQFRLRKSYLILNRFKKIPLTQKPFDTSSRKTIQKRSWASFNGSSAYTRLTKNAYPIMSILVTKSESNNFHKAFHKDAKGGEIILLSKTFSAKCVKIFLSLQNQLHFCYSNY